MHATKNRPIRKDIVKRHPQGKQRPLAAEIFAQKAANDRAFKLEKAAKRRAAIIARKAEEAKQEISDTKLTFKEKRDKAEKRLGALKKEILDEKRKNNTEHLQFIGGIVAGTATANFVALQTEGQQTLIIKGLLVAAAGTFASEINKEFFFQSGIYKEMIREINDLIRKHIDSSEEIVKVPDFKTLFDQATELRVKKREAKVPLKTVQVRRIANAAVWTITLGAITNLGLEINDQQSKLEDSKKDVIEEVVEIPQQSLNYDYGP